MKDTITLLKEINQKQDELIEIIMIWTDIKSATDLRIIGRLESEIAVLKSQLSEDCNCSKYIYESPEKPNLLNDYVKSDYTHADFAKRESQNQEQRIPIEIDFSEWEIPNEPIKEYAFLKSGRIVVMGKNDSYWFEKDGTNNKDGRISKIIWSNT